MNKAAEILKNYRLMLLVTFLLSLAVRFAAFYQIRPWDAAVLNDTILIKDPLGYHELAIELLQTKSFENYGAFRTPIYPLFIALIYFFWGVKPWNVMLVQIGVDSLTVIIVFLLAKEIFEDKRIAIASSLLYAFNILSVLYCNKLFSEILFTFVLTVSILFFIKGLKQNKNISFIISGLLVGTATLVRPISMYLPLCLAVIFVFNKYRSLRMLHNYTGFICSFLIIIGIWQIRNYVSYGHYSLSSIKGYNLYEYNAAMLMANIHKIDIGQARDRLDDNNDIHAIENPLDRSDAKAQRAIQYILEHPFNYALMHLGGIPSFFSGLSRNKIFVAFRLEDPFKNFKIDYSNLWRSFKNALQCSAQEYFITVALLVFLSLKYLFFILGLIFVYRLNSKMGLMTHGVYENARIGVAICLVTIGYFAFMTGPLGYSRFRIPVVPLIIIIATKGLLFVANMMITHQKE